MDKQLIEKLSEKTDLFAYFWIKKITYYCSKNCILVVFVATLRKPEQSV